MNASAYGDEQRVPLRVPPSLFLAPLPLARALVVGGVIAAPLLLADGRIVLGLAALAVGVPMVVVLVRALDRLSHRFVVLVPAGFVVVDPMTLTDPVLFVREHIVGLQAVDADVASRTPVLDLRLGATLGSVALHFNEPAEIVRVGRGRKPAETVRTEGILVAVIRRADVLRLAASRRIRVQ